MNAPNEIEHMLQQELDEMISIVERAAASVEREACAKIAESAGRGGRRDDNDAEIMRCTGALLADRIRARGKGAQ